jgi:hypothetical protein
MVIALCQYFNGQTVNLSKVYMQTSDDGIRRWTEKSSNHAHYGDKKA